jgi:hypothetical protein
MSPYPAQTRYVRRAAAALGLRFEDLDDSGGYLFSVSDGRQDIVSGSGAICTWPLNSATAFGISRDKHHANRVMARAGVSVIPGHLFFLDPLRAGLRAPGRERDDALAHFALMRSALFCKPNQGSRGDFAEIVPDLPAFHDYLERVSRQYDSILLEPVIAGNEYRVFCLDGDAIFCAGKADFVLRGDGRSSIAALVEAHNAVLRGTGVSPLPVAGVLAVLDGRYRSEDVPRAGETIAIAGRRNLSAGSAVQSLTTSVPPELTAVACAAAGAIGLRVAGIDIFDVSKAGDLSSLIVIEANGNPGIQSLEAAGREDVIEKIWTTVLTRAFEERRI